MKLLIFLFAAAFIAGCKPKQTVTVSDVTLEDVTSDSMLAPPPPPPSELVSKYASLTDWLEAMSMRKPPHDSIIVLHFTLHELKSGKIISLAGSAQYDIFDHSWLKHLDFVPADGFHAFRGSDIRGNTREELQEAAGKVILSFLEARPKATFFSRAKAITIGWVNEEPIRLR